jgi:hypothetical protein
VVDVGDDLLEQLSDVVVVQLVDHPAPVALADHQPEMAKQPQLMRHRRPEATGHEFAMPRHEELDLFDPPRSPTPCATSMASCTWRLGSARSTSSRIWTPGARTIGFARTLRGSSSTRRITAGATVYVQPTVTFVYPHNGPVSEDTPFRAVLPILRSALVAEQQTQRFARAGGRGVVLRLGLLDGPGTWYDQPMGGFGATLHVFDAGRALLSALSLPSGIYNVCRDGERVSTERFIRAARWHPQR